MKRSGTFAFLIAIVFVAHAQENGSEIVLGKRTTIFSKILNEKRTLWIYLPDDYNELSNKKYPVAYLLDGSTNFIAFTGIIHHLGELFRNELAPRMIVVGILNTDRTRDLTPTKSQLDVEGKTNNRSRLTGGGIKFISFIQNELIPYVDSSYHVSDFRILIGHSLGGLTVVNCLINYSDLFTAYVAIDPSMWWDNKKLLLQASDVLGQKNKFNNKYLFLAIANTMPKGMDTLQLKSDTSSKTIHIRSIFNFRDELTASPQNGLIWNYKYYSEDTHGSVPLIAEYDAMRFIFSKYVFEKKE